MVQRIDSHIDNDINESECVCMDKLTIIVPWRVCSPRLCLSHPRAVLIIIKQSAPSNINDDFDKWTHTLLVPIISIPPCASVLCSSPDVITVVRVLLIDLTSSPSPCPLALNLSTSLSPF